MLCSSSTLQEFSYQSQTVTFSFLLVLPLVTSSQLFCGASFWKLALEGMESSRFQMVIKTWNSEKLHSCLRFTTDYWSHDRLLANGLFGRPSLVLFLHLYARSISFVNRGTKGLNKTLPVRKCRCTLIRHFSAKKTILVFNFLLWQPWYTKW